MLREGASGAAAAGFRAHRLLTWRRAAQVNDRWEICVSVSDGQFQQARPAREPAAGGGASADAPRSCRSAS